jgi:hypothetical protein
MKNFTQVKITLFDSTIANFKLGVEANFTRNRQDGSVANLAYVSNRGSAILNPSIYLVFTTKGETFETTTNLYTSFPQLYHIRKQLNAVADLLEDTKGFVDIDGVINVRPEYVENPFVVTEIGKQNRSIGFELVTIASGEDGIVTKVPGVKISLSDSEYLSVLTTDEFLTVVTIVNDLDLTSYLIQLSHMFLQDEPAGMLAGNYYQPAPQPYQQPYQQPQQQYSNPGYGGRYQNQPALQQQSVQRQPRYGQAPMQQRQPQQVSERTTVQQPAPQQQSGLPRRGEKPIVNLKSVEETPIMNVGFDDQDAINSIFDDE